MYSIIVGWAGGISTDKYRENIRFIAPFDSDTIQVFAVDNSISNKTINEDYNYFLLVVIFQVRSRLRGKCGGIQPR